MTTPSLPPKDPATRLPSLDVIIALQERLCAAFGGEAGVKDLQALETISTIAYSKAYSASTSLLAAHYLQDIVQTKPFVSGNRMVAWATACLVVAKNDEPMAVVDASQAARIILGAESAMFTLDELARFIGRSILHGRTLRERLRADEEAKAKRRRRKST